VVINSRLVWLIHWTKGVRTRVPALLVVHAKRRINFAFIYTERKGWGSRWNGTWWCGLAVTL